MGYLSYDVDYGTAHYAPPNKWDKNAQIMTEGQLWTAGKLTAGGLLIYTGVGAVGVAETTTQYVLSAKWLTSGFALTADGIASLMVELFGGDSGDIPATWMDMFFGDSNPKEEINGDCK